MTNLPDLKFLIVDDVAKWRGIVCRILEDDGFANVHQAVNGLEALAELRRERYDCLISDIGMPGLGGMDLLRQVKQDPALQSVAVILMTAHQSEQYRIHARSLGAIDCLEKPFASAALVALVRSITPRSE